MLSLRIPIIQKPDADKEHIMLWYMNAIFSVDSIYQAHL